MQTAFTSPPRVRHLQCRFIVLQRSSGMRCAVRARCVYFALVLHTDPSSRPLAHPCRPESQAPPLGSQLQGAAIAPIAVRSRLSIASPVGSARNSPRASPHSSFRRKSVVPLTDDGASIGPDGAQLPRVSTSGIDVQGLDPPSRYASPARGRESTAGAASPRPHSSSGAAAGDSSRARPFSGSTVAWSPIEALPSNAPLLTMQPILDFDVASYPQHQVAAGTSRLQNVTGPTGVMAGVRIPRRIGMSTSGAREQSELQQQDYSPSSPVIAAVMSAAEAGSPVSRRRRPQAARTAPQGGDNGSGAETGGGGWL